MTDIKVADIEGLGWMQMPGGLGTTKVFFMPVDGVKTYKLMYDFIEGRCRISAPTMTSDGSKLQNIIYDHKVHNLEQLSSIMMLIKAGR